MSAITHSKEWSTALRTLPLLLLFVVRTDLYGSIQNENWIIVGLILYIDILIVVAGWVYYDARTRGLENPNIWYLAILLPALGILILPVYLSFRPSTDEK